MFKIKNLWRGDCFKPLSVLFSGEPRSVFIIISSQITNQSLSIMRLHEDRNQNQNTGKRGHKRWFIYICMQHFSIFDSLKINFVIKI